LYCKINDITPETVQHREDMKIRCPRAKIQPENLSYFVIRDAEEPELDHMEKLGP
jgi:arginase